METDASDIPIHAPRAEGVDVTAATPVVRSPEIGSPVSVQVATSPDNANRETEGAANGAPTTASSPASSLHPSASRVGPAASSSLHQTRTHATTSSVRPPMLLDTAICVLLVLVFALLCRRVF